jgi:hypothetical protein
VPAFATWTDYLMAWLERRGEGMLAGLSALSALKIQDDPEAIFQEGWLLCDVGEHDQGMFHLRRAVARGYFVVPTLVAAPAFDAIRGSAAFQTVLSEAERGRDRALASFREGGGERLLGA